MPNTPVQEEGMAKITAQFPDQASRLLPYLFNCRGDRTAEIRRKNLVAWSMLCVGLVSLATGVGFLLFWKTGEVKPAGTRLDHAFHSQPGNATTFRRPVS